VLSAAPGLSAHRELLGEFLQSCDLAKFGGWNLDIDQMSTMLESARRFIQSAADAAESAAPGAAGGTGRAQPASQGAAQTGPNPPSSPGKPRVSLPST